MRVVLQIGPGTLTPGPDGVSNVLVVVAIWTGFKQVRSTLVMSDNQQPHSIGSLPITLGLVLALLTHLLHQSTQGMSTVVSVFVVQALIP